MSWPLLACIGGSILAAMGVLFGLLDGVLTNPPHVAMMAAAASGFAGALIGVVLHRRWFIKLGE